MVKKAVIVHTGAEPGSALESEREILDIPEVELVLRGRCRTPKAVLEAVRDADIGLCYGEPYTREVFEGAPGLKGVVRYGIGVDTIDLQAATDHGVVIAHFPDFCVREVANHALAHILACAKKMTRIDRAIRGEGWAAAKKTLTPMGTIHNQTLGLVAFGNIARALAERAAALEMKVIAHDPFVDESVFYEYGVEPVSLEEVAARSDYVSCHLPLNEHTRGMLGADFFRRMKPGAYFINTSRGGVVNEPDLITALRDNWIAGAGLDVFASEPIDCDHPFCEMDHVILTPHSASYADDTFASMRRRVGIAALAIARGERPEFVANRDVLG